MFLGSFGSFSSLLHVWEVKDLQLLFHPLCQLAEENFRLINKGPTFYGEDTRPYVQPPSLEPSISHALTIKNFTSFCFNQPFFIHWSAEVILFSWRERSAVRSLDSWPVAEFKKSLKELRRFICVISNVCKETDKKNQTLSYNMFIAIGEMILFSFSL